MFFFADIYNLTSSFHSVCCPERTTAFWQIRCRFIISHMSDNVLQNQYQHSIYDHTCSIIMCMFWMVLEVKLLILRCAKVNPVTPKMPFSFQKFTAVTRRKYTVSSKCTGPRLCATKQTTMSNIIQLKSVNYATLHTDYQGSQNNKSWLMPYICCH